MHIESFDIISDWIDKHLNYINIVTASDLVHEVKHYKWDLEAKLNVINELILRQEHLGLFLGLVDIISLVNEVRNYGLFLVLRGELLRPLRSHLL